jgi:hypothetical protein
VVAGFEVVSAAASGPEVVSVVDLAVAELEVVFVDIFFVALVSVADVAEPQASVDIAVAFDVLVPVSVVSVEVDSSGRPRFLAFPNVDYYASSSSSVEVVGQESVHNSIGVRANHGLCSILSNPGLHHNKNLGHDYNNPSPGYNNVSDTSDLPIDATTNHSRKTSLHLYKEQHTHRSYRATLLHPEVPQIQWVVAEKFQYLYLPLPLLEWERQLSTPKALFQKVTSSFCYLLYPLPMPSNRLEDNSDFF